MSHWGSTALKEEEATERHAIDDCPNTFDDGIAPKAV